LSSKLYLGLLLVCGFFLVVLGNSRLGRWLLLKVLSMEVLFLPTHLCA
jgi:hypothetical protein